MKDQDLIDLVSPRIPDEWRRKYLVRPIERLPADMNAAFDRIYKVEREKDQLRADLSGKLQNQRFSIVVLYLLSIGEAIALCILAIAAFK